VNEGATIALALRDATDVSAADTGAGFSYAFDCGNGAGYSAWGSTTSASCPTADNGIRVVHAKLRDKDGGERAYNATVTVTNVAPSVGPITAPTTPLAVTTAVKTSAPFSDPGSADTHTAVWDWGDGTTSAGTITAGTVGGSRTYAVPGVYTVQLTVRDDDGGAGSATYQYVVVYDPSGGFVTGGGWIDSPKGAYAANPDLTGRATFGFVAKYQKGATKPSGQTQFQFHAGDLNFHSTAYEWLVVSGARAQYKGTGTINGTGDYGFLLTANDGQLNGGGGTDKFRIKIWDTASGAIVYDNQRGATDDAAVTTALQSGSIVIHTGK
jgi:PKD repeat protein